MRKKRFDLEYKAVNNNIKRRMKKANENWIGEQCCETEANLRKKYEEERQEVSHAAVMQTPRLTSLPRQFI